MKVGKVGDLVKFPHNSEIKVGIILKIEPNSYDPRLWESVSILVDGEVWTNSLNRLEVISENR